jgi:hypothetical protein
VALATLRGKTVEMSDFAACEGSKHAFQRGFPAPQGFLLAAYSCKIGMKNDDRKEREEAAARFYEMIGRCIAEWAQVDSRLFLIFRDCLGPYDQSAIIYYRMPGLDLRFGLTDEIVRSVLPRRPQKSGAHDHPSVKAWLKAKGDYQQLLATRRRIAHHPVIVKRGGLFFDMPAGFLDVPMGFFDAPPFVRYEIHVGRHEALREKSADLPSLGLQELMTRRVAVAALKERLRLFLSDVLIKQHQERPRPTPPQSHS